MDRVADLLIRIKNGYMAKRVDIQATFSNLNISILEVLKTEGYIKEFTVDGRDIKIDLQYNSRKPALMDVKRISKPGRRIYMGKTALPRVLDGMGIALISTPKGVMTDKKARKEGVGGEVMAYVW